MRSSLCLAFVSVAMNDCAMPNSGCERIVPILWSPTMLIPHATGPAEATLVNEIAVMRAISECGAVNVMPLIAAFLEPLPAMLADEFVDVASDQLLLLIVMPLAAGGDLFGRIADSRTVYNERVASRLFRELLLGLRALHGMGLVHRDLKPENLLLASQDDDSSVVVGDFGLACPPGTREPRFVGTAPYGAPECHGPEHIFSEASDVWSAGCILYALLSGIPPFYAHGAGTAQEQSQAMIRSIRNAAYRFWDAYWADVSEPAKDLCRRMLQRKPEDRITVDDALKHPW